MAPVFVRLGVLALGLIAGAALAASKAATERGDAFDSLPRNERVVAALKSMPPNSGVDLGKARVIGPFNETARHFDLHRTGPRARDYSLKMVWAPERKRALYCGANHAVPHRLNDVWEFDLGALTWNLLYAPDNSRSGTGLGTDASDVEYREGVLITRRGGPVVMGHTWWGLTYDPVEKRLLHVNVWGTNVVKAITEVGGDPSDRYTGVPLWSFSPETRRWQLLKSAHGPRVSYGGLLEYVPELGGAMWHLNNWRMRGTWLYDAKRGAWTDIEANRARGDVASQSPGREAVAYYDPARKIVVAQYKNRTFHFDVAKRAWTRTRNDPPGSNDSPAAHDAHTPFYFDPGTGHGLLIDFRTNVVWAYDPATTRWTRPPLNGEPMPTSRKRLAYVDPEHRVLVVIAGNAVWGYRYAAP